MPMVPSGFVHQGQLDAEIKNAIGKLGPDAVHFTELFDQFSALLK